MAIRYAIAILLILWVLRTVNSLWKKPKPQRKILEKANRGTLLTDPVCGCMVEKDAAVVITYGGRKQFFCSRECAERYRE